MNAYLDEKYNLPAERIWLCGGIYHFSNMLLGIYKYPSKL
jgi:hypothetical protein